MKFIHESKIFLFSPTISRTIEFFLTLITIGTTLLILLIFEQSEF